MTDREKSAKIVTFLWDIAELLWGAVPKSENQNIVLPFVVLRRLDYVLAATKPAVLEAEAAYKDKLENREDLLCRKAGFAFYNKSPFTFETLLDTEAVHLPKNLQAYILGFSPNVQQIFERFRFDDVIRVLHETGRLYKVMSRFNEKSRLNLAPHDEKTNPDGLTNHEMGMLFEELIRRYNEDIKENPGEHFTPKDVIRLLVKMVLGLFPEIDRLPTVSVYDGAAGTGGILTVAREEILARNPKCRVFLFGQELNPRTWAICKSDILLLEPDKKDTDTIKLGSTLSNDQHADRAFDLQFANPPYGFKWEMDRADIEAEARRGFNGRFGAGLPRISDGQLLFLQHKLAHMNREAGKTSYVGIVFNGSPLFTGDAGSGESEVRRWVLENDYLYALVALPEQIFYNTGIQTYLWILTNRKPAASKGKILLLDGSGPDFWAQLPKSIGAKRRTVEDHFDRFLTEFAATGESAHRRIVPSTDFGYRQIQVERPLRLNFAATEERLAKLRDFTAFNNLAVSRKADAEERAREIAAGEAEQARLLAALRQLPTEPLRDAELFDEKLAAVLKSAGLRPPAPLKKAIYSALSERDETARPVVAREVDTVSAEEASERAGPRHGLFAEPLPKGKARLVEYEPDPELRDHENVPLLEDVEAYFDREVAPHVPDAWINPRVVDEKDGRLGLVGYEINFNRYFYAYQEPRPLSDIDRELTSLEEEIMGLLKGGRA
jgi:type I restriction enzyme M protein